MDRHPTNPGNEVYGTVYEKKQVVFRQGDPGEEMYVILKGRVEISRSLDGVSTMLAVLGPHDLLGEMALISGDARSAAAKALDTARLP